MLVFAWLLGCPAPSSSDPGDFDPGSDPGTSEVEPPPEVTFHRDVKPLLARHCAQCHQPRGLGPGDFLDYPTASAWAEVMIDRLDAGEMPPPAADPECHPYRGMEHMVVDPTLVTTLETWVALGKPEGDAASTPPVEPWAPPPLSRRDLELHASGAVVPQLTDGNEYRCFLLDDLVEEDSFITGLEFLNDHPEISHHALLFIDPDAGSEALVQDAPSRSWPCQDTQPEPEYQLIHAWAPSGGALEFPDGMGMKLPAGAQLVLQMHYFGGIPQLPADQPGYALKLEPAVDQELYYIALGPTDFIIPAGDPSFTALYEIEMFWLTLGLTAYDVRGVLPHMHLLGTGYDFYLTEPDGDQKCISRADQYDFAMQPTYWFDEPVPAQPEDKLSISCTWDNSASNPRQPSSPPQNVTWGENTQEEMCFALFYVTARSVFE